MDRAKSCLPHLCHVASGLTPTISLQLRQRCFIQVGKGILTEIGGRSKQKDGGKAILQVIGDKKEGGGTPGTGGRTTEDRGRGTTRCRKWFPPRIGVRGDKVDSCQFSVRIAASLRSSHLSDLRKSGDCRAGLARTFLRPISWSFFASFAESIIKPQITQIFTDSGRRGQAERKTRPSPIRCLPFPLLGFENLRKSALILRLRSEPALSEVEGTASAAHLPLFFVRVVRGWKGGSRLSVAGCRLEIRAHPCESVSQGLPAVSSQLTVGSSRWERT